MNTLAPSAAAAAFPSARADFSVIGLIGLAHGMSHFFQMLLPSLFPFLIGQFGYSYSELGLLMTVFFVISSFGQAGAGFLVDRVGACPVLFVALSCFVVAALLLATAQGYSHLMVAAALAGVGNASFHPVDFTILNKRVSAPRLGHAFSVHGITGNLGWALAPVFVVGVTSLAGNWRAAPVAAALLGAGVLLLLWLNRGRVDDRQGAWAHDTARAAAGAAPAPVMEPPMAFLKLPSVWLCFSFFFWSTVALSAIQGFASPALSLIYGLPTSATAFVVTGYMLCGAAGMVMGGFVVARVQRLEATIAVAMSAGAVLLLLVASGWLAPLLAAALAALAGFGTGIAGPSRDMLIKRAAPPGATGRVYGTVYSGLDVGFATAAPVFGWLLDAGHGGAVFGGAALALLAGVGSAALVGLRLARPLQARTA
jgi:MFS transporter, FSR family, fosmidomycin resistance protein